ncbi:cytochrome P450 [Mycobacteroides stephanolepidis]|uniref:Cytochrome P450 n=1 Tax=[Mycobacterium] stephanolepidis TaxID=1520670 RepID=A0A1Z4ETE5_9MYCO|nr:cytochrome P450 [[Mycobacterium] stephanolepidis]
MFKVQMTYVPADSGLKPIYGSGLPGIVQQFQMLTDRDKNVRRQLERFGDITYSKVLGHNLVSVMSPAGAQAVTVNRDKSFANEPAWNFLIGVAFRRGILLMDFDEHRHHRAIMQQAFTNTHLKGYLQEM